MVKSIYFVNPPNPHNMKGFPGSLLALDLWLRQSQLELKSTILDEEETVHEDLYESLSAKLQGAPEEAYFGITCTTATYQDALKTAMTLRDLRPNSTIILGGHHVTGQEQVILREHPEIDYIITGEGEKALESLLQDDFRAQGIHSRSALLLIA